MISYTEAIRDGFRVINRNWQLVLIQLLFTVISCIGFFFIVVIPVIIMLLVLGFSYANIIEFRNSPGALLMQHTGLIMAGGILLLFYLLFMATLGLYIFAGSSGVIATTVMDDSRRFSLRRFHDEGKRLFFPILGYTALVGLAAIGIFLAYAVLSFIAVSMIEAARGLSQSLAIFLGIFFGLAGIISGFLFLFGFFSITVYGVASLSMTGWGAAAVLRDTVKYIFDRPSAFYLYVLLIFLYIVFSIIITLMGLPLRVIPVIGLILSLPYQIMIYALQGYAGLFLLSVAFVYYFRTVIFTGSTSRTQTSTSSPEVHAQGSSPHQSDTQEQS